MRVRAALTLGLILLAAAATGQTPPLRLLIWADYLAPGAVEAFTAETGTAVVVETYDSGDLAEAVLMARGSGYDLAVVPSEFIGRLVDGGALRPLEPALLPPLDTLDPALMARLAALDPGHRHARPYLSGTLGIGYDPAALDRRLGPGPRDSWAVLFDPATVAKLADCGVAMINSVEEVVAAAMLWQGRDPNARTGDDTTAALAALAAVAPHVAEYTSSFIEPFAEGQFCMVLGWSGDVLAAAADAAAETPRRDLRYVVPREGSLLWADLFVVPVDAPRPALAHRFMAFMHRPSVSAAAADYNLQPSPVRAAAPLTAVPLRDHLPTLGDAGSGPPLVMLRSVPPARKAALLSAWTRLRVAPLIETCLGGCPDAPHRR